MVTLWKSPEIGVAPVPPYGSYHLTFMWKVSATPYYPFIFLTWEYTLCSRHEILLPSLPVWKQERSRVDLLRMRRASMMTFGQVGWGSCRRRYRFVWTRVNHLWYAGFREIYTVNGFQLFKSLSGDIATWKFFLSRQGCAMLHNVEMHRRRTGENIWQHSRQKFKAAIASHNTKNICNHVNTLWVKTGWIESNFCSHRYMHTKSQQYKWVDSLIICILTKI